MGSRPKSMRWLDRLSVPLELGAVAVGVLLVWYFTDLGTVPLIGAGIGMGLATLWQPIKRRYGINRGWGKLLPGFGLLVLGIYSFMLPGGIVALKAVFILVGGWLVLDAIYDIRTGTGTTVPESPNPMEQFGDAAIVGRALDDEPRSLGELDSMLDLSQFRIENALDMLMSTDAIDERNGCYYATLEDRSLSEAIQDAPSQAANRLSGFPARLIRPLRLFND